MSRVRVMKRAQRGQECDEARLPVKLAEEERRQER
jgi:hypothetical protein